MSDRYRVEVESLGGLWTWRVRQADGGMVAEHCDWDIPDEDTARRCAEAVVAVLEGRDVSMCGSESDDEDRYHARTLQRERDAAREETAEARRELERVREAARRMVEVVPHLNLYIATETERAHGRLLREAARDIRALFDGDGGVR